MRKENLLIEGEEAGAEILAEGVNCEGKKETDVEVLWQRAGVINRNNRVYPKELLAREIKKINQRIESGESVWGNAFHPADAFGKPTEISHRWKKVWMQDNGECKGILSLVGTRAGEDIKALIQTGKIGISSRGTGTTTAKKGNDGKEYLQVNDDYEMTTPGDFVVAPSVQGAGTLDESFRLYESQLSEAGEEEQEIEDRKMENADIMIEAYKKAKATGEFKGTLVEFKSLHPELDGPEEERRKLAIEALIREYDGFQEMGYLKSFETFKEEYGASTLRRYGLITEAEEKRMKAEREKKRNKGKRVKQGDIYFQARAAGIDPAIYTQKINEQLEKEEATSQEERDKEGRIMAEAKLAGFDRTALAPSFPKRDARAPYKKSRDSVLAPSNVHIEDTEPEPPTHVFKTRKEIIESAKTASETIDEREEKARLRPEHLASKKIAEVEKGASEKESLEKEIQALTKAIEKLNEKLGE